VRKLFLRAKILKIQCRPHHRHVQRGGRVWMLMGLRIQGKANLGEGGGTIIIGTEWMIGDGDGVR
jgi:hypothetical protein